MRFDYRLTSPAPARVSGGIALDTVVSDGAGWSRTLHIVRPRPFDGAAVTAAGTLDLQAPGRLTEKMRALTGSPATVSSLDLVPHVDVSVLAARAGDLAGLLVGVLMALPAGLVLVRRRPGSGADTDRIALRYGSRSVRAETTVQDGRWVMEFPNIASLVHVADRYNRVILHSVDGASDTYVVDDGFAVYRYRSSVAPSVAGRRLVAVGEK